MDDMTLNEAYEQLGRVITPVDFTVENHGTIFLLRPHTEAAKEWVDKYLPEDAQTLGDAIAVEHRYIEDIVIGIQQDGLEIK